jgi:hypothetical protein
MAGEKAAKKARKRGAIAPAKPTSGWPEAWEHVSKGLDEEIALPPADKKGFATFELSFEQALTRQLAPFFHHLPALELAPGNIKSEVPPAARGAYYLLLKDEVVYIGKSDAKTGLQTRLLRHYKTLRRRKNIDWREMKFKAVKVASLAALDTESLLLHAHKLVDKAQGGRGKAAKWNNSGFGSNDTGAERDTQKVSFFDWNFPLDLDAHIEVDSDDNPVPSGTLTLDKYLDWLHLTLQLTFRRQEAAIPAASRLSTVSVDAADMVASMRFRDLLRKVHENLPLGWTLVILRGKLLLNFGPSRTYKSPLWVLEAGSNSPGEPTYKVEGDAPVEDDATDRPQEDAQAGVAATS